MTKGKNERRHIQNRAWEKDRRDRLNKTFEKLAKLLPEYRPKVTFSKIEILLKTIVYIEDLRKKMRDILSKQNESMLKIQEELEESIKMLLSQNNDLVKLLENSNIKVPHFDAPKSFRFIINMHDVKSNDENEKSKKPAEKKTTTSNTNKSTVNKSHDKPNEVINKPMSINEQRSDKKIVNSLESLDGQISLQKTQLSILPEIKEVQSFGSVDLIPVTNTSKSEMKVHEKPVNNFVEITPLVNSRTEKVPVQPEKICILGQFKEDSNIQESKDEKNPVDVSAILNKAQQPDSDFVTVEQQDGKSSKMFAVEKLKNNPKLSCNKSSADSHGDKKLTTKQSVCQEQKVITTLKNVHDSLNIGRICAVTEPNKTMINQTVKKINNDARAIETNSGKKIQNLGLSKGLTENISNEKDLSDELFGNFPLPQIPNESNPNALSPTAAFLLSFPVVSTVSCSKPTETDNSYSEGTNLLRLEDKPNQPKDHSLFESISSILNDLNDVSDGKQISSVDNNPSGIQFSYCTNKPRINSDTDKSNALNSIRSKPNQRNLNIYNQLNDDDRMKQNPGTKSDSSKLNTSNDVKKLQTDWSANTNNLLNDRTNYMASTKTSLSTFENTTENASDFYVSLSTLGLPMKSAVATLASTPINPSSHFNFQIPSLAQPRNLIDTRPLIADTPFTFSLTKCSDTTTNTTSSTTKTISIQQENQTPLHRPNKTIQKKNSPTKHLVNDRFVVPSEPSMKTSLNRCNTYNPFAFDNPPMLSSSSSIGLASLTTVSAANSTIGTPFTFTLTPTFSSISASTPLLSNHDPLFSSSFDMPIMRSTTTHTKTLKKDRPVVTTFGSSDKESTQPTSTKSGKTYTVLSTSSKPSKNLVNWMTSSVNKPTQELQLDFISTVPEEPSAWSPNRMNVDSANLISSSSALPMLQGDLALNTISNSCSVTATKYDFDSKKSSSMRTNTNHKYNQPKQSMTHRKSEQNIHQLDRNGKSVKNDKNLLATFKTHHHSSTGPIRMNEPNPTTNNFHSVSQLLDQERQTANKNTCYIPNDGKMLLKDNTNGSGSGSTNGNVTTKQKMYSKYEPDAGNHQLDENKFATIACSNINSDNVSNECDRDLFGGYFFSQPSKRLKLNYHHTPSEFLGNQNFPSTAFENSNANDILTPYTNYQTYDSDCNNVSMTNLSNQTYSYQYTQPYNHQTQQQSQSVCDPIDSSNYFQTSSVPSSSMPNYKSSHINESVIRGSNTKTNVQQSSSSSSSFLHQTPIATTKSNDPISNSKICSGTNVATTFNSATNISSTQMCSINRNASACPSKTIHYPSHSNINNLQLNQTWNDSTSFSWMPYTNPIEKPYTNNNLFNSTESSTNKTITTNIITGNNNTIPNFNLTTIFPDYNKS